MLPKKNRLKKKKDFERVFKKGEGAKKDYLVLKVFNQRGDEDCRFAFIVSQKVSKKATVRNKVRRRLREIVRKKIPFLKKGIDGIFIALPGLEEKNYQEIEKMVEFLFRKMKIFKNEK